MARITVEDCLQVVDNRFELVMMAAKRARQLADGVEPSWTTAKPTTSRPCWRCARSPPARIDTDFIDAVEKAERERKEREALEWAAAEVVADDDVRRATTERSSAPSPTEAALRGRFCVVGEPFAGIGAASVRLGPHDARRSRACPARPPRPTTAAVPDYVQALERAAYYLDDAQRAQLRRAWAVGAAAHAGQTRKSGEPYITHPVAVAQVLAELGLDVETLVAAILHDTIEDTPLTRARRRRASSARRWPNWSMASPSWTSCSFADRQEAAAESFRKMLLAMSRDLRVILIKLADRLHNMRTLGAQTPEARRRIAARNAGDLRADRAAPGHEPGQGRTAGPRLPRAASVAARGDRQAHPQPAAGAARGAGADRGAAGAAAGARRSSSTAWWAG